MMTPKSRKTIANTLLQAADALEGKAAVVRAVGKSVSATSIGKGENGYIARYKGKTVDVYADTTYEAQQIAAKYFKARKEWQVSVMLAELRGKPYIHDPAVLGSTSASSVANTLLQAADALEGKAAVVRAAGTGHHYHDGKSYYVDTAFMNSLGKFWPEGSNGLKHMGMGEFVIKLDDGTEIEFDRMRGKDFPNQVGRSHQVYDNKNGKAVEHMISLAEKKGGSELQASSDDKPGLAKLNRKQREVYDYIVKERDISTGHLKTLGMSMEHFLRFGQLPKAQADKTIGLIIERIEQKGLGPRGLNASVTVKASGGSLFDQIKAGSRVTIVDSRGNERTGKAVMRGPAGWVLNMGGRHGTPGIASEDNVIKVSKGSSGKPGLAYLGGR